MRNVPWHGYDDPTLTTFERDVPQVGSAREYSVAAEPMVTAPTKAADCAPT
jgi:hypothetical protein